MDEIPATLSEKPMAGVFNEQSDGEMGGENESPAGRNENYAEASELPIRKETVTDARHALVLLPMFAYE
uniref:Uncharacterized protein n=1 Tax=Parascaris univalens TaxID=6257 RepID=A0A914ZSJ7_PARUN